MRRALFLIPFAALLVPAFAGDKKAGKDPEGYAWEPNFDAARIKAAEQGKLLFVDFWFEG